MQEKLPDVDTPMVWILLEAVVLKKNNITIGSSQNTLERRGFQEMAQQPG